MSLSCTCGDFDSNWYWELDDDFDFRPLETKRSRKCCSCEARIAVGADCVKVCRYRPPSDRCNYIEEAIYGDEVPLATWYLCEACGGLLMAITDLGFCCTLGDESLQAQISEFNDAAGIPPMKSA